MKTGRRYSGDRQRGIALLTAMLIVSLATVVAVNLLWATSMDLRRTENLLLQDQGRAFALAAEDAAKLLMVQVFEDLEPGTVLTSASYEQVQIAFEAEGGGSIAATIEEVQGRFNLNNLVDRTGEPIPWVRDHFQRLLTMVIPLMADDPQATRTSACDRDPQALTESLIDWLDPDDMPELSGAEEAVYTSLVPPYRPANYWFTSTSELLAVNCFTPALYQVLEPYVIALPPRTDGKPQTLNVNTGRAMVLNALSPSGAPPLEPDAPTGAPFQDIQSDFVPSYPDIPADARASLSTDGIWFLLRVSASIGSTQVTMYSLLERRGNQVVTRLRTFGG